LAARPPTIAIATMSGTKTVSPPAISDARCESPAERQSVAKISWKRTAATTDVTNPNRSMT
jgi:hypothetical protein